MAADIHALEIEFAKNPTLEACIPLCEAYMAQKRFMEAMVVCKKGIKQAPQDGRGRVLLARVYGAQGKAPKAQAELEQFLQEAPGNPLGLEALGRLYVEQGRRDEGLGLLQQALAVDPGRADARAILQQAGVSVGTPAAAPAPAAPVMAPPRAPGLQMPPPGMMPHPPGQPPQPQGFGSPFGAPPQGYGQPAPPPPLQPGHRPPMQGFPPAAPMGAAAPAPVPAEPPRPQLEHVHDFFAPETLGFTNDASDIETAGPGRLTILGFVPKSTGSIKTTLFIALVVFAGAGAVIFQQYRNSVITREINKKYGELKVAMDEDKYGRYQDVVRKANEILGIDDDHNQTLGALAYAYAVMAVDYRQPEALAKAKEVLARAMRSSKQETEYRVAARALIAYAERQFDQGVADVKKIMDEGGSSPLIELEAFRIMAEAKPGDKETQMQLRRLTQSVTSQARIFNFLGWYYYMQDDWQQADKNFASALQNVRDHARALIGQALTDFDRGIGLQERQKEIGTSIKKVLMMPAEDLDENVQAIARFANAQLMQWQDKEAEAQAEYAAAFKLDAKNPLMWYRRGTGLLAIGKPKAALEFLEKAAGMQPNSVRYWRTLADAQIRAGDTARAKATLGRASELNPGDPELKVLEGDRLRAEKKWAQAIEAYKGVKREHGGIVLTRAALGISAALRDGGKKQEAVKYVEDFLGNAPADLLQPEQAKLWCELGYDYESVRNKELAERYYTQGVDVYRYEPSCHLYACRLLRGEAAKEECKTYLVLSPRGEHADEVKKRLGQK